MAGVMIPVNPLPDKSLEKETVRYLVQNWHDLTNQENLLNDSSYKKLIIGGVVSE